MEAGLRGAKKGFKSFFFVLKGRFDNLTVNRVFFGFASFGFFFDFK